MKNKILILVIIFCVSAITAQQPVPNLNSGKGVTPQLPTAPNSTVGTKLPTSSYAVVIGISDYQDTAIPDLRFADKDAEAFANYLRSKAGGSLDADHLKVLLNSQATMAQFANVLDWLMENAKEGDQAIIYFSGHGDVERKTISQPGYLLCWDAPARVYLAGGALSLPMFQDIVTTLSVQNKAKVVVIADACHSGKLAGSSVGGAQITGANLAKQYANEIKILSCQPNEYSIEGEQWGGGRGAFSYNLVNALYGLADNNKDNWVTLQEVSRYLEDHVTTEVAPMSQVPIVIGDRTEKLAGVDAQLLATVRTGKSSQLAMLSSIESKGIEDLVLAGVDTTLLELYHLFKKALKDKTLIEPINACANTYYGKLIQELKLERLHSSMKRNYAAALQDDAQQAMNIWLKADVQQLECIGKSLKLEPIPRLLERAAELLGDGHYMYRSLRARKLLFEGIVLSESNKNPNVSLGQQCLSIFKQSMQLEPQSPLTWYNMSLVYLHNLRQPDSAFTCVREAEILAPNWVLPFVDLGYYLYNTLQEDELAKLALLKAEAIDSSHPYVINRFASLYGRQGNFKKAIEMSEKYRQEGGLMYPCWHNDYGLILLHSGKFAEAESEMLKAIALDSTEKTSWINLGHIYHTTRRFNEAETAMKKGISLDSTYIKGWGNLGSLYLTTGKYIEAEKIFKQVISLDTTLAFVWSSLGNVYRQTKRYHEAETTFKKVISMDSTNVPAWNSLGIIYYNIKRYEESESVLKKAISLDSTITYPWSNLGYLYNITQRYTDAELVWKKTISMDSTKTTFWGNLGYAYLHDQRYHEAESAYKKVISIDSTRASAWLELGGLYLVTHEYSKAEYVLQKAISLDSNVAGAHKVLATIYLRAGRLDEARQGYLKVQKLSPKSFGSYIGMAYLFARENKYVEAFTQLDLALQNCPLHILVTIPEDEDLASLRELPEWKEMMKKYFP